MIATIINSDKIGDYIVIAADSLTEMADKLNQEANIIISLPVLLFMPLRKGYVDIQGKKVKIEL